MMNPPYGIPAILSVVFPGLGQLVKKQYNRAVLVWVLMALPWGLVRMIEAIAEDPRVFPFFFRVIILANLAVHLWQIVDAYNCPHDFDLS